MHSRVPGVQTLGSTARTHPSHRPSQVPFEVDIVSAHRTPDKLVSYSRGAHERGLQCIIAGAGGAAHLPGMVAAMTPLPVIGVPVKTSALSVRRQPRASCLEGIDG